MFGLNSPIFTTVIYFRAKVDFFGIAESSITASLSVSFDARGGETSTTTKTVTASFCSNYNSSSSEYFLYCNYILVSDIIEIFHEYHRNRLALARVWFSMVQVEIFQYFWCQFVIWFISVSLSWVVVRSRGASFCSYPWNKVHFITWFLLMNLWNKVNLYFTNLLNNRNE